MKGHNGIQKCRIVHFRHDHFILRFIHVHDLQNETLIFLSEAAKRLPNRPSTATLWRWHSGGVRGVLLETIMIGGRRYTSVEAMARFITATTAQSGRMNPPARTTAMRKQAILQAEAALTKDGI